MTLIASSLEGIGRHTPRFRAGIEHLTPQLRPLIGSDISNMGTVTVLRQLPWNTLEAIPRPWTEEDTSTVWRNMPIRMALQYARNAIRVIAFTNRFLPAEAQIPQAKARLVRAGSVWRAVVDRCPYCLGGHSHGIELRRDSNGTFGFRQHLCEEPGVTGARGYMLVDRKFSDEPQGESHGR